MLRFSCYVAVLTAVGVFAVLGILRGVDDVYIDHVMLQIGMVIFILWVPAVFLVTRLGWSPLLAPLVVGSALAASGPLFLSDERLAERERATLERTAELAELAAEREERTRRSAEERAEQAAEERAEERRQEAHELAEMAAGAVDVAPEDLLQMFTSNEVGAGRELSRRAVLITGVVGAVRATEGWSWSSAYIQFADGVPGPGSVNAYFTDDFRLRNLTPGVVVSAVCNGSVALEGLNVEMSNCRPLW